MKKLYHTEWFDFNFFFDEDFKLIHQWSCNDAQYRHEYMSPLFEKLGYEMKFIDPENKKVKQVIIEVLKNFGYSDEDFE